MYYAMLLQSIYAVFEILISPFIAIISELITIFKKKDIFNEKEVETVEWCKRKLGVDVIGLEELWEFGARSFSSLLEDESDTWIDLQNTAVEKIKITPSLDRSELRNPHLELKSRKKFLGLIRKIMKFIEKEETPTDIKVSQDIIARGVGLYAAYTLRRAVFYVYSLTDNLDDIKIKMKGKSEVTIESKMRKGRLMVGYVAPQKGTYFLYISKNGWMAPGCPFEVFVDDAPPNYQGSFGAFEWDLPEEGQRRFDKHENVEKYDKERRFSKIVRNVVNARRLFFSPKSKIPEIRITDESFSVWSSMTEFGPPERRRSFTYISSEGATFPLSLSPDASLFDAFENVDIFQNDKDIWAVETDKDPFSEEPEQIHGESDFDDNNQLNESIFQQPVEQNEVFQLKEVKLAILEDENIKNLLKENEYKFSRIKKERQIRPERRCRSILSVFDLKRNTQKKDLRRTKSAFSRLSSMSASCMKSARKVIVKIGEYTIKEEIKSAKVKKLKHYWDNMAEKKDVEVKKNCSLELKGVVSKRKSIFENLVKNDSRLKTSERNSFSLENSFESLKETKSEKQSKSLERDLNGIFEDMGHGIGKPGIPNRLGLLATLRSIQPGLGQYEAYEPNYPHLPTTKPSEFKSRSTAKELIPWNAYFPAY